MFSRWIVVGIIVILIVVTACSPSNQSGPMRIVLPTQTQPPLTPSATVPTATASATHITFARITYPPTFTQTATITNTPIPMTETATPSPTATTTPTKTDTPTATITNTPPPYVSETPFVFRDSAHYAEMTYEASLQVLRSAPILFMPDEHMRRIYERGQSRGLQHDFLLNIGDCNTENVNYLEPLTYENSRSLAALEEPLSSQMLELYTESFRFKGQSVNSGLNSLSVMDPFWARDATCLSSESPIACDVRRTQPFASVVMFGANDINVLTIEGYENAMRDIIEYLLSQDVIPIISTFSVRPDVGDLRYERAVRFNGVLVRLAGEYNIPLINFWLAAQDLPDRGILSDNAHLKQTGFLLRNELTVEMLDYIQTNIIELEITES